MYLPQPPCMDRMKVLHQPSFGPRLSKLCSLQFVKVWAKWSWSGVTLKCAIPSSICTCTESLFHKQKHCKWTICTIPTIDQATLRKHRLQPTHLHSPPQLPLTTHVINSLQLETNCFCHVSTKVHAVLPCAERSSSRLSLDEWLQGTPLASDIFYVYIRG